jgi:hypothetical protein
MAHIVPECRTGRIVLVADRHAPDQPIRVTVEYADMRKILWDGPPPKSPRNLNYMHRGGAMLKVYVLDSATGEWTEKDSTYIPAIPGNRDAAIVGPDKVALGGLDLSQHSKTWELITFLYHAGSDMLSCVDVDKESLMARMEEQNRVPRRR